MWCTDVTPCAATYAIAASRARSSSDAGGAGTTRSTRFCALSLRMPVGSPVGSRTIVPPAISAVARVTACRAQRGGIGERHVAIKAIHPDRIVGGHRVDPRALGKLPAPALMIPVAAGDPGALRNRGGEFPDASNELLGRAGVAQLHRREPESALEEVDVGVDEPGGHELAAGIYRSRLTGELPDLGRGAHGGDAVAGDGDGRRPTAGAGSPVQTRAFTTARVMLGDWAAVTAGFQAMRARTAKTARRRMF